MMLSVELDQANRQKLKVDSASFVNNNVGPFEYEYRIRMSPKEFEFLNLYLRSKAPSTITIATTHVYEKEYKESTFRRIYNDKAKTTLYDIKDKRSAFTADIEFVTSLLPFTDAKNYKHYFKATRVRYSITKESLSDASTYNSIKVEENLTRTRHRTTFAFTGFKIDLTKIDYGSTRKPSDFQVEIEFTSNEDATQHLMTTAFGLLYPQLSTLFSKEAYMSVYTYARESSGLKPVNIMTEHIVKGVNDVWVTNKLDGVAYSVFFKQKGKTNSYVLFLKNKTDCIILAISARGSRDLESNQLRCELFKRTPTEYEIHLYDIVENPRLDLFSKKKSLLDQLVHEINGLLQSSPYGNGGVRFRCIVKTFFDGRNIREAIQKTCNHMLQASSSFEQTYEDNDGIIFQPEYPGHPLKWKFFSKISIDFYLQSNSQIDEDIVYDLYVMDGKDLVKFVYNGKPARMTLSKKKLCDGIPCRSLNKLVVECLISSTKHAQEILFEPHRIRWDKDYPNAQKTAKDTYEDMVNERTLNMLQNEIEDARATSAPSHASHGEERKEDIRSYKASLESACHNQPSPISSEKAVNKNHSSITEKYFPNSRSVYTQTFDCTTITAYNTLTKNEIRDIYKDYIVHQLNTYLFSKFPTIVYAGGIDPSSTVINFSKCLSVSKISCSLVGCQEFVSGLSKKEIYEHNLRLYRNMYPLINTIAYSSKDSFKDFMENSDQILANYSFITGITVNPVECVIFDLSVLKVAPEELENIQINVFNTYPSCKLFIYLYKTMSRSDKIAGALRKLKNKPMIWQKEENAQIYISITPNQDRVSVENNAVKEQLIKENTSGKYVLDLGSGKGGDLVKYIKAGTSTVVMTEPNNENIIGLKDRLGKNKFSAHALSNHYTSNENSLNVYVYHSAAQDFTITGKVDVVSMFFVLTFFFHSEALLDRLIDKIDISLSQNGSFIGATVIGSILLADLMKHNGTIDYPELAIHAKDVSPARVFGNEIEFNFKYSKTATKQTEWLVDWQTFVYKLATKGIYLQQMIKPNVSLTDSNSAQLLLKSTVGFVFKRQPMGFMIPLKTKNNYLYRVPAPIHNLLAAIYNANSIQSIKAELVDYAVGYRANFIYPNTVATALNSGLITFVRNVLDVFTFDYFIQSPLCMAYVSLYIAAFQKPLPSRVVDFLLHHDGVLADIDGYLAGENADFVSDLLLQSYDHMVDNIMAIDSFQNNPVHEILFAVVADLLQCKISILWEGKYMHFGEGEPNVKLTPTLDLVVSVKPTSQLVDKAPEEHKREAIFKVIQRKFDTFVVSVTKGTLDILKADQLFLYLLFLNLVDATNDPIFATDFNVSFLQSSLQTYLGFQELGMYANAILDKFMEVIVEAKRESDRQAIGVDANHIESARTRMKYLNIKNIGLAVPYGDIGFDSTDSRILEAFASSRNRYFQHFCSAFPDVDVESVGNFFKLEDTSEYELLCVNPPYELSIMTRAIEKCYELCDRNDNLTCMFILPDYDKWPALDELKRLSYKVMTFNKRDKEFKDYEEGNSVYPVNTVYCYYGKKRTVLANGRVEF